MRRLALSALMSLCCFACSAAPPPVPAPTEVEPAEEIADLSAHFGGLEGAFVLYDERAGSYLRHNPRRCAVRLSPCSTFKIPNTLIALDAGVADGADFLIPWDRQRDPEQPWWKELGLDWTRDHTLASAFANSVVWYYREVARRIGEQRMASYLERFDYGNRDISSGLDEFWLSGSLAISANEQVEFLRKVSGEQLGVSHAATETLERILVREQGDGWVLRAKTGSGAKEGEPALGWLVGWVEAGGDVHFFALNVTGEDPDAVREARLDAAMSILRARGVLPAAP